MITGDASEFYALADRLGRAPAGIRNRAGKDVGKWTTSTEQAARMLAPELTGELRAGIHARARGLEGEVVSDAGHSVFVEEGTSDTAPQPFMRPAVERTLPVFDRSFEQAPEEFL